MTRFKQLRDYQSCIISNGKTFIFDRAGSCVKEDAGLVPEYTSNMVEVSVISVLQSNNVTMIAVELSDGQFRNFSTDEDFSNVVVKIQMLSGFSHLLTRKGKANVSNELGKPESIRFSQVFFVYPSSINVYDKLKSFKLVEGK